MKVGSEHLHWMKDLTKLVKNLRVNSIEQDVKRVIHVCSVCKALGGSVTPTHLPTAPSCPADSFIVNLVRTVSDVTVTTGKIVREEVDLTHNVFGSNAQGTAQLRELADQLRVNRQVAVLTRDPHAIPFHFFMDLKESHLKGLIFSDNISTAEEHPMGKEDFVEFHHLDVPGGLAMLVDQLYSLDPNFHIIGIEAGPKTCLDKTHGLYAPKETNFKRTLLVSTYHGPVHDSVKAIDPIFKIPDVVQNLQMDLLFHETWSKGAWDIKLYSET